MDDYFLCMWCRFETADKVESDQHCMSTGHFIGIYPSWEAAEQAKPKLPPRGPWPRT